MTCDFNSISVMLRRWMIMRGCVCSGTLPVAKSVGRLGSFKILAVIHMGFTNHIFNKVKSKGQKWTITINGSFNNVLQQKFYEDSKWEMHFRSNSEIQLSVICSLHKISEKQVKAVREWFPLFPCYRKDCYIKGKNLRHDHVLITVNIFSIKRK